MRMSEKIKAARKAAKMTQKQLAEQVGCPPLAISFYETDRYQPEPERLARIAEVLGVTPDDLQDDPETYAQDQAAYADDLPFLDPVESADAPDAPAVSMVVRQVLAGLLETAAPGADPDAVLTVARELAQYPAERQDQIATAFMVLVRMASKDAPK